MQRLQHDHRDTILFAVPSQIDTEQEMHRISKREICSAIQMLHCQETIILKNNDNLQLILCNHGKNNFTLRCVGAKSSHLGTILPEVESILHSDDVIKINCTKKDTSSRYHTFPDLLHYIAAQLVPIYSHCVLISGNVKNIFGHIPYSPISKKIRYAYKDIQDTFSSDNASTVSKLTDILNAHVHRQMINRMTRKSTNDNALPSTYSSKYAARLLQISSIFCASVSGHDSSLMHVSQNFMSGMDTQTQECLYESVEPEKQHLTILLRGEDKSERIVRINLAVRIFPSDHVFTTECLSPLMKMNASESKTSVMVVTGVYSGHAAAIYINSDTKSDLCHKMAMHAYMTDQKTTI